jgi:diguanylate cyclase (GGDEF)-like protein/PAS domain S-box-containing protein
LRLLADNSGDVIWLADQQGRCVWVSQSITDALGWDATDWIDRPGTALVTPSSEALFSATVRDTASRGIASRAELQYCTLTGNTVWMADRVHAYNSDVGEHSGTIHALRTVDREVRYRQELQASESRLRIAMNISPVGMAVLDSSHRISSANHALAAILGVPCDDLIGRRLDDFIGSTDRLDIAPNIVASAIGGPPPQSVFRVETPTRSIKWCSCESATMPSAPHNNHGDEFVVQIRDVTHEVLDREELEFRAAHDRLTGLMNRASMEAKLDEVMSRTPRSGALIGVLYCDIDDFKLINDNYGHKAGDIVLMVSAKRITRILRPSDVVARIGGDEIVVILDGVGTIADCVRVGETLRAALAEPLDVDGRAVSTSISVGAAIGQPGELPQDLLDRADASLYRAKRARHNDAVSVPG